LKEEEQSQSFLHVNQMNLNVKLNKNKSKEKSLVLKNKALQIINAKQGSIDLSQVPQTLCIDAQ